MKASPSFLGFSLCAGTLSSLALFTLALPGFSQTFEVVTEPVGFTKVTVPAASVGNTVRRVFAAPYQRAGVFQSAVSAVGSNTLTLTGAAWTASQFTNAPYFVGIRKGAQAGRFFRITSHTDATLTVENGGVNLSTITTPGDSAEIFPAHTLGSLFGTASVPFKTGANETGADLVRLRANNGWVSYFHDGTNWRTPGNGNMQNDVVIAPDQGFFLLARGTSPLTLHLNGEINLTRQRSNIPGSGEALVGNRFPAATTLSALQIQNLAGWTAGDAASGADNVLIWNGNAWDIYYYNAGNWEQVGSFGNANNTPIAATGAVLIHRKQDAAGSIQQLAADSPFTGQ